MNLVPQLIGVFVGVFLGNLLIDMTFRKEDSASLKNAKEILVECQKNLPRNEFCELKAVPKQKNVEEN